MPQMLQGVSAGAAACKPHPATPAAVELCPKKQRPCHHRPRSRPSTNLTVVLQPRDATTATSWLARPLALAAAAPATALLPSGRSGASSRMCLLLARSGSCLLLLLLPLLLWQEHKVAGGHGWVDRDPQIPQPLLNSRKCGGRRRPAALGRFCRGGSQGLGCSCRPGSIQLRGQSCSICGSGCLRRTLRSAVHHHLPPQQIDCDHDPAPPRLLRLCHLPLPLLQHSALLICGRGGGAVGKGMRASACAMSGWSPQSSSKSVRCNSSCGAPAPNPPVSHALASISKKSAAHAGQCGEGMRCRVTADHEHRDLACSQRCWVWRACTRAARMHTPGGTSTENAPL